MSQLSTSSGDFDISGYNSHFELPRPSNDLEPSSPTYPSLTTRKSVAPAEHPLHNGDGWPYLSMSLDDTGLLYCKSISMDMLGSVNPGTHSDIFPLPTSEDAIDSMTAQQKEVRFGNKLSHIETSEAEFVAQLEHLRDFYMQPLLGQKPVRRSIRKRVFSFDQLTALFQRGNSSTTATSCEVQRSRSCNSHPTQLPNEEQYDNSQRSTGICSMLKGLSRPLNRNHDFKLDHKAIYQPTAQNEAIVSAPFDHVTSLIELHHSFHMALKKARPADMLIHVLVGIFVDHIPRLHTHFAHANALSASLSNFETLVFNDEKLARIIKVSTI
ncbi:hypothetical protein BDF22DRAFT_502178 [Syncephalis plumigaleata]|nr:hypothetical protein BDF22DRAFT_502178 [Syncephalis plumigaleata]